MPRTRAPLLPFSENEMDKIVSNSSANEHFRQKQIMALLIERARFALQIRDSCCISRGTEVAPLQPQ